jgi:hypothetical protein
MIGHLNSEEVQNPAMCFSIDYICDGSSLHDICLTFAGFDMTPNFPNIKRDMTVMVENM